VYARLEEPLPGQGQLENVVAVARELTLAYAEKTTQYGREESDDDVNAQRLVAGLQKELAGMQSHARTMDCWRILSLIGLAAADRKPEGYMSADVPVRSKGEPGDAKAYRMAVTALKQAYEKKPGDTELKGTGLLRKSRAELVVLAGLQPEIIEQVEVASASEMMRTYAHFLLDTVSNPQLTSERLDAEWPHINRLLLAQNLDAAPTDPGGIAEEAQPRITYVTVERQMLRPDIGSRADMDIERGSACDTEPKPRERMSEGELRQWLAGIAMIWSGEDTVEIAHVDLDTNGTYDYMAAILPESLPDGRVIYHAVAESQDARRATFVFRGERGQASDGIVFTWENVFDGTVNHAKAMGARRMLHTPNLDERIMEYLTRPPDKLDKAKYRLD
jgi:hypothetical protein